MIHSKTYESTLVVSSFVHLSHCHLPFTHIPIPLGFFSMTYSSSFLPHLFTPDNYLSIWFQFCPFRLCFYILHPSPKFAPSTHCIFFSISTYHPPPSVSSGKQSSVDLLMTFPHLVGQQGGQGGGITQCLGSFTTTLMTPQASAVDNVQTFRQRLLHGK